MQNIFMGFRIQLFDAESCCVEAVAETYIAVTKAALIIYSRYRIWH